MNAQPPNSTPPQPPASPRPAGLPPEPLDPRERLVDLLVLKATDGLSSEEVAEMSGLLEQHPDVDPNAFDQAAAGVLLAMIGNDDANVRLPQPLRQRLIDSCPIVQNASTPDGRSREPAAVAGRVSPRSSRGLAATMGWAIAALLALAALAGWWNQIFPGTRTESIAQTPVTLASMERFLRTTRDAVSLPLAGAATGYEGASGEVVWSDQQQTGYFRVSNLAPNNPAEAQYQLWIVDPQRDTKPVDGGVFDIQPGQNVVRIDAKLHVEKPAVFAITREKPGGVVVSAGPLLVVAKR